MDPVIIENWSGTKMDHSHGGTELVWYRTHPTPDSHSDLFQ